MQKNNYHNILIDSLPETVVVSGREYQINTDFRAGILFEQMAEDVEAPKQLMIQRALEIYFINGIPHNAHDAIDQILWFYGCGYTASHKNNNDSANTVVSHERIFDYEIDAPLIYAAYKSQYGIDLQDIVDLHWWKYTAMFRGLKEDERICEIMGYRSIDLSKIEDKNERSRYARLKAKYALPNPLSEEQKVELAGRVFSGGG